MKDVRARRTFLAMLLCVSAVLPTPSRATTTALELYEACSYLNQMLSDIRVPDGALRKVGLCMGFIEAGTDGLLLGALLGAQIRDPKEAGEGLRLARVPYACVPERLTHVDRVRIFLRYVENNAENLKSAPPDQANAINVLMYSVADAYPCK